MSKETWLRREQMHSRCLEATHSVLATLSQALNEVHQVEASVHYWDTALGFWVRNFIDLVHGRLEEIESGMHRSNSSEAVDQASSDLQLNRAAMLMSMLNAHSQSAFWTRRLIDDIILLRSSRDSVLIEANGGPCDMDAREVSSRYRYVETAKGVLLSLACARGIVVASSYFPLRAEIALAFSMCTTPVRWPTKSHHMLPLCVETRQRLEGIISFQGHDELTTLVLRLLPWYLPRTIVEGFRSLRQAAQRGRQPKLIFTANLHCSSDSFAIWAAEQRMRGAVLVISQHGGLNGQGRLPTRGEEFEREVADFYLHWGWADGANCRRIPAQIVAWRSSRKGHRSQGGLLLVTDATFRHNRRPWAGVADLAHYLEMLFTTYGAFPEDVKKQTVVRLHKDHALYDDSHDVKWRARHPYCTLDSGFGPMSPLVDAARLVVCTTLGTTEIEQFSRNVPTVLRLDRHIHALRRGEEALFERMEDVGLVHYSAESLATFLRANWNTLGDWWSDPNVVSVVNRYLARFGHQSRRPVRDIRAVLRDAAVQGRIR